MSHRCYLFCYSCDVNQLSGKKPSKNSHEPSSSLPLLNISSSLGIRHDVWYIPSSNNLPQHYRRGVREETILKHVFLTSSVVMSYNDKFYFEISKLFGDWKLEFEVVRDYLVKCIMSEVLNIAESNNGHCGVLELSVDVKLVSRHVIEERILFPSQQYGMVPASKSSMQSLLKKTEIDEKNSQCMVCLEELAKKEADHEILSMPCSHMFHEECITKWLQTSHYCPICRFEMPS
ncbi:E3 ubiquitin-protein ligase MBR1-like [Solanum dulcamara]|uniref:E3 ubiquitin-protein ligase MBR1-like n=1 Tax=Solanum dulcamara TaxID=45834 RepID=UPI002484FB91|nr:E3 ubiquitin-protein ligase MBR1-like [Solanum dulcamara]